jgi:uncharacterized protein (DUF952 family)
MNVLHIASRQAWVAATRLGQYAAPSLASEGFIHCSTLGQVLHVAAKFYNGQTGLVLLVIDPARLTSALKWGPPSDGKPPPGVPEGEAFPHIYGPLNPDAVLQVLDFDPDADGNFSLPASLESGR